MSVKRDELMKQLNDFFMHSYESRSGEWDLLTEYDDQGKITLTIIEV